MALRQGQADLGAMAMRGLIESQYNNILISAELQFFKRFSNRPTIQNYSKLF